MSNQEDRISRKPYGFELLLDLHKCDASTFNRKSLGRYFEKLCNAIEMEREDLHFWDYDGVPEEELPSEAHLLGTSAVQFIKTSNIVIHTLDLLEAVYVSIFSCKEYDAELAEQITKEWFGAKECKTHFLERI
jgi:S-adenosylmethionine/arginine decarboxylase-like enzyme|tara:strand:- start:310 stop:708 length:399 start_codon:yes stop_codon:yes gene_type:complete